MQADRTPPDVDRLPALPPRFSWQLPHVKQPRRPYPDSRQIEVDGKGPALASISPGLGHVSTTTGVHRALQSGRHHREFASRDAALRYVAAWAWKYADQLITEIEEHRARGFD